MKNNLFSYDNVSWNLPLLFCHDDLIFLISDVLKFFKDIKKPVFYAYGSPISLWAGGRAPNIKIFDKYFIEKHINKIIETNFIPVFTFTNSFVKKEDLNDEFSNWLLDFGVEHGCELLVASNDLFNYIKSRRPEAKISASILQGKMEFHNFQKRKNQKFDYEFNFYNDKMNDYERIVPRPEFIFENLHNLQNLHNVSKLEVLINETCVPNCPMAVSCYANVTKNLKRECSRDIFLKKGGEKKSFSYSLMMKKNYVDDLVYKYGIKHLKIQGRHYNSSYLFNLILYYLFNVTGNFQTIYPLLVEKYRRDKLNMASKPYEQKIVMEQMLEYFKKIGI